jgi:hypothetical protein
MNRITSLIVAEHRHDLQREADVERLARAAVAADVSPRRGPVRRLAGRSARVLGRRLAALAARLDPIDARQSMSRPLGR